MIFTCVLENVTYLMKRNCVTLSSAALGCVLSFHGRRIVEALQERERKKNSLLAALRSKIYDFMLVIMPFRCKNWSSNDCYNFYLPTFHNTSRVGGAGDDLVVLNRVEVKLVRLDDSTYWNALKHYIETDGYSIFNSTDISPRVNGTFTCELK